MFGGAGRAVTGLVKATAAKGAVQTVVVPRSALAQPAWAFYETVRTLNLPRLSPYFGDLGLVNPEAVLRQFPELASRWDLIHIHAINFAPLADALSGGKIPVVYTVHSFFRQELADDESAELRAQFAIQDELLMRVQRIHLLSNYQREYLASIFPNCLSKTEVIPLGVMPPQRRWQGGKPDTCLYVGRLLSYKGIEDLVKALYLLRQNGRSCFLEIVGKGPGDYEERLHLKVRSYRLGTQVHFNGWEPDEERVGYRMENGAVLVVPSHREAFGLVALEGMAVGVPLVVANTGGLKDFVTANCALLYPPGDVQQLARALGRALNDPKTMRQLAANARRRAVEFYWPNLAGRYLALYASLI